MLSSLGSFQTSVSNIASMFTVPSIGSLYYKKRTEPIPVGELNFLKLMDMFKVGIPIFPDKYEVKGGNDIGQQVLVGGLGTDKEVADGTTPDVTGALVKVADNIVVNPRVWIIHGYIGLNIENSGLIGRGLQASGTLAGTVGLANIPEASAALTSFIQKFGRGMFNTVMTRAFEYISEARRPFRFTTIEGEKIPSLIKSYSVKKTSDNLNWVEIDLEIQEFRYIALVQNGEQVSAGGLTGLYASGMDAVRQCGRTALRSL